MNPVSLVTGVLMKEQVDQSMMLQLTATMVQFLVLISGIQMIHQLILKPPIWLLINWLEHMHS